MKLPTLSGVVRRRVLVNYRVAPEVMAKALPARFRPKLRDGYAIAGMCLIRLERIRPRRVPAALGLASENAAHRVAVTWADDEGREREGVYIWRRDTGSLVNHLAGGRLFPGEHHRAAFEVTDDGDAITIAMASHDDGARLEVHARAAAALPPTSCFDTLEAASRFFEGGAVGYSVRRDACRLDGIRLVTRRWSVSPLAVERAASSELSDPARFPRGSVELDCALVMRDVEHEWHAEPPLVV